MLTQLELTCYLNHISLLYNVHNAKVFFNKSKIKMYFPKSNCVPVIIALINL